MLGRLVHIAAKLNILDLLIAILIYLSLQDGIPPNSFRHLKQLVIDRLKVRLLCKVDRDHHVRIVERAFLCQL